MDITIKMGNGKGLLFEGLQTLLWHLQFDNGTPYINECNGHNVIGREVGPVTEARRDIVDYIKRRRAAMPKDQQLDAMALEAVGYYESDEVRAESWHNAIGVIVENTEVKR